MSAQCLPGWALMQAPHERANMHWSWPGKPARQAHLVDQAPQLGAGHPLLLIVLPAARAAAAAAPASSGSSQA